MKFELLRVELTWHWSSTPQFSNYCPSHWHIEILGRRYRQRANLMFSKKVWKETNNEPPAVVWTLIWPSWQRKHKSYSRKGCYLLYYFYKGSVLHKSRLPPVRNLSINDIRKVGFQVFFTSPLFDSWKQRWIEAWRSTTFAVCSIFFFTDMNADSRDPWFIAVIVRHHKNAFLSAIYINKLSAHDTF